VARSSSGAVGRIGLAGAALILLALGCARWEPTQQPPQPTATRTPSPSPTQPAPTLTPSPSPSATATAVRVSLDKHHTQSAREAFSIAREAALAWRHDARWYGIIPSASLERTLALHMDQPGWVYRFGTVDSAREYIVHVVEGRLAGKMQLRIPDYIEPPLAELSPLDGGWGELLDSPVLLEEYAHQDDNVLTRFPNMKLDYRLVHLKGSEHPVWVLFDADHLAKPLFEMDARRERPVQTPSALGLPSRSLAARFAA